MVGFAGNWGSAASGRVGSQDRLVFEYVQRSVGGETGRFIELVWFARGQITGVRERIAPTGSTWWRLGRRPA